MKVDRRFQRILGKEDLRKDVLGILRSVSFLSNLADEDLLELLKVMKHVLYLPGETLFLEQEDDRDFHLVLSGEIVLFVEKLSGRQDIITRLGARSFFGEIAFLCGTRRTAAAKAGAAGAETLVLSPSQFEAFLQHNPHIMFKTISGLISDVNRRVALLPKDYGNYVVWGYLRRLKEDDLKARSPVSMMALVGLAGGAAGLGLGYWLWGYFNERVASWADSIGYLWIACHAGGACLGVLLGGFGGWIFDQLYYRTLKQQKSERCCMNCKYIRWDPSGVEFSCAYHEMEQQTSKIIPGDDFDTYTDCGSFVYKQLARIKKKERDVLRDHD